MTYCLPPNLLALFAPRDPVKFIAPITKPTHYRNLPYSGVAQFLSEFEDPSETPLPVRAETRDERKERKRKEKQEKITYKLEQDLAFWDPLNNPESTSDPFKSLFVARINYDTSESKLRREFEVYGPIKSIRLVKDKIGTKPRGYAFIEYEHERDMHAAYKHADGRKIDGKRVLVDVERARTVRGWRPRRLGGGLGSTRRGRPDENSRYSGRDDRDRSREKSRKKSRSRDRRDRDRKKRSRSRSAGRDRRRHKSRSRDRAEKRSRRSRSRDKRRSRDRGDKSAPVNAQMYGEYGAEISEEYNNVDGNNGQ